MIEKTHTIQIRQNPCIPSDAEMKQVNSVPRISLNQLLEVTKLYMTPNKFFAYSGYDNNCQVFKILDCTFGCTFLITIEKYSTSNKK